jgi:hypothetical protein
VLERVLRLAGDRRARTPADEVAILEDAEVRPQVRDKLVNGARPEDAADDRSGLKRCLFGEREKVDASGEDRLD